MHVLVACLQHRDPGRYAVSRIEAPITPIYSRSPRSSYFVLIMQVRRFLDPSTDCLGHAQQ